MYSNYNEMEMAHINKKSRIKKVIEIYLLYLVKNLE